MRTTLFNLLMTVLSSAALANDGGLDTDYGQTNGSSVVMFSPAQETTFPKFARSPLGTTWMIGDRRVQANALIATRFNSATGLPDLGFGDGGTSVKTIDTPGVNFYYVTVTNAQADGKILVAGPQRSHLIQPTLTPPSVG